MRAGIALPWLLPLAFAAAACLAQSPTVYRWTDPQGRVHYGDRLQDGAETSSATRVHVPAEPTVVARLRIEDHGDHHLAWADNLLAGPIEVLLHGEPGAVIATDPALPARATVPARGTALLAVIAPGRNRLHLEAMPGTPNVRLRHGVEYGYPLQSHALRIQQAWDGSFSHADAENRHAVDFAAASGTPVLAARDGTVMQFESGFDAAEPGDADAVDRANFIRILHDDGSMALYAHLQPGGVNVRIGERVRRGQPIGLSGSTGFSTGPHLHFVVQVNRGMRLESVPFRMFGPQGVLRFAAAQAGGD